MKLKSRALHVPPLCRRCGVTVMARWKLFRNRTLHLVPYCDGCARFTSPSPFPRVMWPMFTTESPERAMMRLLLDREDTYDDPDAV